MKTGLHISALFLVFALTGNTACAKLPLDTLIITTVIDTAGFSIHDSPETLIINDSIPILTSTRDTITVMQWNIGHFSMGKSKNSNVTDVVFDSRSWLYKNLIDKGQADFISINEYSTYFSNTINHPRCLADTLLFSEYPFSFFGNNGIPRNYSFNAVFSKKEIMNAMTVEFESNRIAIISHTNLVKATDYYYIRAEFLINRERIVFICTHLAFDKNNNDVAINQLEELFSRLDDEDHVIICGDFNSTPEDYSFLNERGYTMANVGNVYTYPATNPVQPLDNIVVKGLRISNTRILPTFLSDHTPILCDISLSTE